jgi:hypothetical protein
MSLSDRLTKLEAAAPPLAGAPFCASSKNLSREDSKAIGETVLKGYWDRLTGNPVAAEIYATPFPTAVQWATVARIARELMATEAPDPNDSGPKILEKF